MGRYIGATVEVPPFLEKLEQAKIEISDAFFQMHHSLLVKDLGLAKPLLELQVSDAAYVHERYTTHNRETRAHFNPIMAHYARKIANNHRLLDAAIENDAPLESGVTSWMLADSEYQLRAMWQIIKHIERPD